MTRSVTVEGAHLGTGSQDVVEHPVQVLKHVTSGDSRHSKPLATEHRVTRDIAPRLIAEAMSFPVDFDNEASFETGEIDSHLTDRKLFPEFVTIRPFSQLLPQKNLGQAHVLPQRTRALNLLDRRVEDAWAPSTALRAVPLPIPGRITAIIHSLDHVPSRRAVAA